MASTCAAVTASTEGAATLNEGVMSKETPVELMSDESIQSLVLMVESAEIMATAMGVSVSRALEMMLRTMQVMARMQQQKGFASLSAMLSPSKQVS